MNRSTRHLLMGLLLLYLALTVGYSLINPLFEAPDEHHHFFTVLYIAENGRLPIVDPTDEWVRQEAAQPPLYYLVGALLVSSLDTRQAQQEIWLNPFASLGDPSALTNINRFIPTEVHAWPWSESVLAAYLLRFLSALLGAGTIVCIYASGRLLWPQQPYIALLAAGLVAFLPQFNFIHSAISNDTMAIFFCTTALWQLIRLWQTHLSWSRLFWLGVTVGLAILAKTVGLLLLVYVCGVLFLLSLRDGYNQDRFELVALARSLGNKLVPVLLPALTLAGWLWWRNWQLYGDITATTPFIEFAGGDRQYTLLQVLAEWPGLWSSLFAMFGWFNLPAPSWVYWLWYLILLAAAAGAVQTAVARFRQNRQPHLAPGRQRLAVLRQPWFIAAWLFLWVVAVYAGLATFMLRTEAAQGRLLFPALLPLALALAYGLSGWRRWPGFALPLLAALSTTLYCLFFVIRPAYATPPLITDWPTQEVVTVDTEMVQGLTLLGGQVDTRTAMPGEPVWLTLYWRADRPLLAPPELVVELLGRDLEPVGRLHGYHGRGLYPANLWPAGQIVADRFAVRLETEIQTPVWAAVNVGLAGEPQRATVGHVDLRPQAWPAPAAPVLATIEEGILLTAVAVSQETAQPGDLLTVSAQWQVTSRPQADYTTLVHLGQPDQAPLVTGDSSPLAGHYPTHLWPDGAVINDVYLLSLPPDIPPGRYPLWIGMYDSHTLTRLPLMVDNQHQPNDIYLAGWIEIVGH